MFALCPLRSDQFVAQAWSVSMHTSAANRWEW